MKRRILSLCVMITMLCAVLFEGTGMSIRADAASDYNEIEIGFSQVQSGATKQDSIYFSTSNITAGPDYGTGSTAPVSVYKNWGTTLSGTVIFQLRNGTKKEVTVKGFNIVNNGLYANLSLQEPANQITDIINQVATVTIQEGTVLTDVAGEKTPIRITNTLTILNLGNDYDYVEINEPNEEILSTKSGKAKVILLAGQSNATGTSQVFKLKENSDAEDFARYQEGYDNVLIRYEVDSDNDAVNTNIRLNTSNTFVPVGLGQGGKPKFFGPEIGIADYLSQAYPDETFYIIKSSWSGTYLGTDWQEDAEVYKAFVERTNKSFKMLEDSGLEPELFAFCWMQGEADATQLSLAEDYYNQLSGLVSRVTNLYNEYIPSYGMSFIDAGISDMSDWKYHTIVNSAKQQYASEQDDRYYLDTQAEGLTYDVDNTDYAHYDAMPMLRLGQMFGEAIEKVYNNRVPSVELKTGSIIWQNGNANTPAALVSISNMEELAKEAAWYAGIYNGTNQTSGYFSGKVQVDGKDYTTAVWVPGNGGINGYIRFDLGSAYEKTDFVIPAGTIFTMDGNASQKIAFAEEYYFDVSLNMVYPTDLPELMLDRYSWMNESPGSLTLGCVIGNVSNMSDEWKPESLPTSVSACPRFKGEVLVTTAGATETKTLEFQYIFNGEVWFYIENAGITSGTIIIAKDTVFAPVNGTTPIRFPGACRIDIDSKKVIHEENISFKGYNWKNKDLLNVEKGVCSFDNLEWYQKNYDKTEDRELIKATGIAKNHTGEDVSVTIQIQDRGLITCWYAGVKDTRITIPAGTVFKTTTVTKKNLETGATMTLAKQYEFTFMESYELDAATKYVGLSNGQTGKLGDCNIDDVTNIVDLVRLKKFSVEMEDNTVVNIDGWKIGYGSDVNSDGGYNTNDLQPLRELLVKEN